MTPASKILLLSAGIGSGSETAPVTRFNGRLTVRIPFDTAHNPAHLGVYRLNRSTGEWEYRGGKVDTANRRVEVRLDGFSEYAVMEYTRTCDDLAAGHWAKADIELMAARHVVKGTGPTTFSPAAEVTRAQFASLLVRALGLTPYTGAEASFRDVAARAWYFGDVETAARARLIQGDGNRFRPSDRISRQEMAVMLGRALALRGIAEEPAAGQAEDRLASLSDGQQAAGSDRTAVAQAPEIGLWTGRGPNSFSPAADPTRAEAIVVLKRLLHVLGEL